MDGYIINPLWFYWIGIVDELKSLCYAISALCVVSLVVLTIVFFVEDENDESDLKVRNAIRPWLKRLGIACLLTVLLAIFIPSKETLIKMELARNVTYDNVSLTLQKIQEAAKWIIEELR